MDVLLSLIASLLVAFLIGVGQGYRGGIFLLEIPFEVFVGIMLCVIGELRTGAPGRYMEAIGAACLVIFVTTVARGIGWNWKHPDEGEQSDEQDAS